MIVDLLRNDLGRICKVSLSCMGLLLTTALVPLALLPDTWCLIWLHAVFPIAVDVAPPGVEGPNASAPLRFYLAWGEAPELSAATALVCHGIIWVQLQQLWPC